MNKGWILFIFEFDWRIEEQLEMPFYNYLISWINAQICIPLGKFFYSLRNGVVQDVPFNYPCYFLNLYAMNNDLHYFFLFLWQVIWVHIRDLVCIMMELMVITRHRYHVVSPSNYKLSCKHNVPHYVDKTIVDFSK